MNNQVMHNRKIILGCLATLLASWLVVYWPALVSMVGVWNSSDTFTHCFIIVPISLYLLYERRYELPQTQLKPALWVAAPLLFVQLVYLGGQLLGVNLIGHASAYASIVLIVWMVLGTEFILRFKFPFIFLVFTVPFGEQLVPLLQDVTAYMSVELLKISGIPIYREGLYLYIPNGTFLVAEACSGISFLIAAVALGTMYGYLNFNTRWKFFAFILLSFIVPIVANGMRAYGIVVIGYMSDMEHATGADHLIYGWVFFAFVLILLFLFGELFKEKVTIAKKQDGIPQASIQTPNVLSFATMFIAVIGIQLYSSIFIFSEYNVDNGQALASEIRELDPSAKKYDVIWEPLMVNAHEKWSGKLNGHEVYIAKYHFDNDEAELVSGLNRAFNIERFSRMSKTDESLGQDQVSNVAIVDVSGQKLNLIYWYEVDGMRTVNPLKTKINQVKSKLAGRAGRGYFVAVIADDAKQAVAAIPTVH